MVVLLALQELGLLGNVRGKGLFANKTVGQKSFSITHQITS